MRMRRLIFCARICGVWNYGVERLLSVMSIVNTYQVSCFVLCLCLLLVMEGLKADVQSAIENTDESRDKVIADAQNNTVDFAKIVEFESAAEVRRKFVPQKKAKRSGLWKLFNNKVKLYLKGSVYTSNEIIRNFGWLDFFQIVGMNKDTVYTVPTSDFIEERRFKYKEHGIIKVGKIIAVDIQIAVVATKSYYYTNTGVEKDGQDICMKSLKDFIDSGVRIPRQSAEKFLRYKGTSRIPRAITKIGAFKKNAKKRFAAESVTWLEGAGEDGKVRILLLGCNAKQEDLKVGTWTR